MNDLRNQFSDTANSFEVSHGSMTELQQRARRRGQRSTAVRFGAVLAVAGVGLYGVQRLSDSDNSPVVESASSGTGSVPNSSLATGSTPDDPAAADDQDPFAGLPQTRAAQFIPGGYDWAVYAADSPEGLALRFDPTDTYAIATSAGAINESSVYQQVDGAWQPVADLGVVHSHARTNTAIYAIGWDPDEGPSGEIRTIDLASGAEGSLSYPEGLNVATQQVGRITVHSVATLSGRDDLLALLVDHWVDIDSGDIGLPAGWEVGEIAKGRVFASKPDCEAFEFTDTTAVTPGTTEAPEGFPATTVVDEVMSTEPPLSHIPTPSDTACSASFSVDELALTDAERSAIGDGSRLWTMQGTEWTEVELPNPTATHWLEDPAVLLESAAYPDDRDEYGSWVGDLLYAVTASNDLQPLFGGNRVGNPEGFGATSFNSQTNTVTKVSGSYVLTQTIGSDEWHATDLRTLGVDDSDGPVEIGMLEAVPLADGGVFAEGDITTDLPTEPMQLTSESGEYTLSFPTEVGQWTVTNNATGEPLGDVALSTESGRIEIRNQAGSVATFDVDWTSVPALNFHYRWGLFVSEDGLGYRVVDLATLREATGLGDTGLNAAFRAAQLRGEQIVLRNDTWDDDSGEPMSYFFVGTPR